MSAHTTCLALFRYMKILKNIWRCIGQPIEVNKMQRKIVNWIGHHWPASLRFRSDLTDDVIHAHEHKLDVPFYSQNDWYSCGATAGWAVVKTFHPKANWKAFYQAVNPLPMEGTTTGKLLRALRQFGIGVSIRETLSFADIAQAIESGFPLIVGIRHQDPVSDHWIVIYGIGRKPQRIFACNQIYAWSRSRAELSWDEFRRLWNPRGHGFLCWGK